MRRSPAVLKCWTLSSCFPFPLSLRSPLAVIPYVCAERAVLLFDCIKRLSFLLSFQSELWREVLLTVGFPLCFYTDLAMQFLAPFSPTILATPLENLQYLLSILLPGGIISHAEHPAVCRHVSSGQDRAGSWPERLTQCVSLVQLLPWGVGTAVALSQGCPARQRVVSAASQPWWVLSSPLFLVSTVMCSSSCFP